jgi:hypothetical protein
MRYIAALLIVLTFFLTIPPTSSAQVANRGFGGRLYYVMPCTCTAGTMYGLLVIGPTPGWFSFVTGVSILHPYYQLRSGPNVVGSYTPTSSACVIYAGTTCVSIPTLGTIRRIGTSL